MKKSEMYRMAQYAVINSPSMQAETKTEILRMLFENEDVAKYCEKQEEKEKEA